MLQPIISQVLRAIYRVYILSKPDGWHVKQAIKSGLIIGSDCRIFTQFLGGEPYLVSIGNHVTLSKDVELITHDGGVWVFRDTHPNLDVLGKISIGNNVFIGARSMLLPGTNIEDNVVVGAGSIVKGKLESGWVYAGVPAKKIKPLQEYLASSLQIGIPTKLLPPNSKRHFIKSHFGIPIK